MKRRSVLNSIGIVTFSVMLASCGGGGGGDSASSSASASDSSVDTNPSTPVPRETNVTGPDSFLLFPNPQVLVDGTFETNTTAYADAYYTAIDPDNSKDTLDKWKAANGFGSGMGTEKTAIFGDVRDLGYGRRMTLRQNPDGTVAAMVENYLVNAGAGYSYTSLNLDAAIARDARWHIGTNGIEFSPGPNGGASFAKFYTFDPVSGARLLTASLDNRTPKAMPGICISCHGGRGDPLTPPDPVTGKPLFPLVMNSVSQQRGDTQARLHPLIPDHLDFSSTSPYTRAEQEAAIKVMNMMVLCTYPRPSTVPATGVDACRPDAGANEWQGTTADVLKAQYGGDQMPNATASNTYVPQGWLTAGQSTLYGDVAEQVCMTCHMQRGTANQNDLDFTTYDKYFGYADRIRIHVFDRGNMPLAKIVADRMFSTPAASELAAWLESNGFTTHDGSGAMLLPGRPVADPGPDHVVRPGNTTLSAANSLFASTYAWSIRSNPGSAATLTNANSATPTFSSSADGTYVLQLIASKGSTSSAPASLTIVVDSTLPYAPEALRFADIKAKLDNASLASGQRCTFCHTSAKPLGSPGRPPIFYTNEDRDGDGVAGTATDDAWFYKELRGRINFTDIAASPLLRKPSGHHHNGGLRPGFDTSAPPGDPARADYDMFLNWILNGAPQ